MLLFDALGTRDRQPHNERRADVLFALVSNRALMFFDDHGMRDRQTLAGPLANFLGGEERVEDPLADGLRDAAAGIAHAPPRPSLHRLWC